MIGLTENQLSLIIDMLEKIQGPSKNTIEKMVEFDVAFSTIVTIKPDLSETICNVNDDAFEGILKQVYFYWWRSRAQLGAALLRQNWLKYDEFSKDPNALFQERGIFSMVGANGTQAPTRRSTRSQANLQFFQKNVQNMQEIYLSTTKALMISFETITREQLKQLDDVYQMIDFEQRLQCKLEGKHQELEYQLEYSQSQSEDEIYGQICEVLTEKMASQQFSAIHQSYYLRQYQRLIKPQTENNENNSSQDLFQDLTNVPIMKEIQLSEIVQYTAELQKQSEILQKLNEPQSKLLFQKTFSLQNEDVMPMQTDSQDTDTKLDSKQTTQTITQNSQSQTVVSSSQSPISPQKKRGRPQLPQEEIAARIEEKRKKKELKLQRREEKLKIKEEKMALKKEESKDDKMLIREEKLRRREEKHLEKERLKTEKRQARLEKYQKLAEEYGCDPNNIQEIKRIRLKRKLKEKYKSKYGGQKIPFLKDFFQTIQEILGKENYANIERQGIGQGGIIKKFMPLYREHKLKQQIEKHIKNEDDQAPLKQSTVVKKQENNRLSGIDTIRESMQTLLIIPKIERHATSERQSCLANDDEPFGSGKQKQDDQNQLVQEQLSTKISLEGLKNLKDGGSETNVPSIKRHVVQPLREKSGKDRSKSHSKKNQKNTESAKSNMIRINLKPPKSQQQSREGSNAEIQGQQDTKQVPQKIPSVQMSAGSECSELRRFDLEFGKELREKGSIPNSHSSRQSFQAQAEKADVIQQTAKQSCLPPPVLISNGGSTNGTEYNDEYHSQISSHIAKAEVPPSNQKYAQLKHANYDEHIQNQQRRLDFGQNHKFRHSPCDQPYHYQQNTIQTPRFQYNIETNKKIVPQREYQQTSLYYQSPIREPKQTQMYIADRTVDQESRAYQNESQAKRFENSKEYYGHIQQLPEVKQLLTPRNHLISSSIAAPIVLSSSSIEEVSPMKSSRSPLIVPRSQETFQNDMRQQLDLRRQQQIIQSEMSRKLKHDVFLLKEKEQAQRRQQQLLQKGQTFYHDIRPSSGSGERNQLPTKRPWGQQNHHQSYTDQLYQQIRHQNKMQHQGEQNDIVKGIQYQKQRLEILKAHPGQSINRIGTVRMVPDPYYKQLPRVLIDPYSVVQNK